MPLPGRRARRERADVVALVRELGNLLGELNLSEVEIERTGVRVRVQRAVSATTAALSPMVAAVAPAALPATAATDAPADGTVVIEAPMVGTFYRASSPTTDPYVREGDAIKQGQILCIIEAMKLMNEIEAKLSGRLVKVLVENSTPVEYGQPLFHIDPNG